MSTDNLDGIVTMDALERLREEVATLQCILVVVNDAEDNNDTSKLSDIRQALERSVRDLDALTWGIHEKAVASEAQSAAGEAGT